MKPKLRKRDGVWYLGVRRYGFATHLGDVEWVPVGTTPAEVRARLRTLLSSPASAGTSQERSGGFNPTPPAYYGRPNRWRSS